MSNYVPKALKGVRHATRTRLRSAIRALAYGPPSAPAVGGDVLPTPLIDYDRIAIRAAATDAPDLSAPLIDYETHPAYADLIDAARVNSAAATSKFLIHLERIHTEAKRCGSLNYLTKTYEKSPSIPYRELFENGYTIQRIAPARKRQLLAAAAPMIATVEAKLAAKLPANRKFSDNHVTLEPAEAPEVASCVTQALIELGLDDAIRSYTGHAARITNLAVQINEADNTEFLYYSRFTRNGFKPGKASYMHVDSGLGCPLKILIYLADVSPENGPFRYTAGSPHWADPLDLLIRKATDRAGSNLPNELFLALPATFRRRTHFGFDLPDEHPSTAAILSREMAFTSDIGDLVCFDFNGFHRGGMVREGRRVILQAVLH